MRFAYAARFENTGPDEVVVSFRDLPECLTSGADEVEALEEAQDALEAVVAARINRGETIPTPSEPLRGEHLVAVPTDMSAKAAFVLAFRESGLTQEGLAQRLGTKQPVIDQMLDPRDGTTASDLNRALRVLGSELVVEVRDLAIS